MDNVLIALGSTPNRAMNVNTIIPKYYRTCAFRINKPVLEPLLVIRLRRHGWTVYSGISSMLLGPVRLGKNGLNEKNTGKQLAPIASIPTIFC